MQIKERIGSDILTRFILGLNSNFWARYNPYFDRIAIYYKDKLITSYQRNYLPRHDIRSDVDGDVLERGYQHVLQTLWEAFEREDVHMSYDKRKTLIKLLEELNYFHSPVSYMYHETTEDKEAKRKKNYLYKQYGVGIHTEQEK